MTRLDPPEDLEFSATDIRETLDAMAAERRGDGLTYLAEWMSDNYAPSDALEAMSDTGLNSLAASLYAERGLMWKAWRESRESDALEILALDRPVIDDTEPEECGQFFDGR